MKIFVSHARKLDYENDLYRPIKESDLNYTHEFFLPHKDDKNVKTKEIVKNSDLFLVEATHSATGVGIELGWADAFGVPIVCVSREGEKISGSLKYLTDNFIEYTDSNNLIEKLSEYLSTTEG